MITFKRTECKDDECKSDKVTVKGEEQTGATSQLMSR